MGSLTIPQAFEIALSYHQKEDYDNAKIIYEKILEISPNNPDALHLLGVIAYQKKDYKDAINKIEKALKFKTSDAGYYVNLALCYDKNGDETTAKKYFEIALEKDASHIKADTAHFFLGVYHSNEKEFDEAFKHYEKALEINKELYDTYFNRALMLLLLGRFEEGWRDYEFRFKKEEPIDKRIFNKPKWKGENFNGKKLLLIAEQGFGDNIQFARYIPLVKERGGEIIFECRKELLKLFEKIPGIDRFATSGGNNITEGDFDYYIHIMSLPGIFNTNIDNIPRNIPYLKADKELVEKFKPLFKGDNLKVGIVWKGNPLNFNDKKRSIDFNYFRKLINIPKIDFYSLQKGENLETENEKIVDLSKFMGDFADTAALIENMDLIISVDTAIVHLAGALNKKVWTLLPFIPDWRYMLDRKDCLWYPSMRLFRQSKAGDWDSVFIDVEKELKNLTDKK